jgi:hypothetical protein
LPNHGADGITLIVMESIQDGDLLYAVLAKRTAPTDPNQRDGPIRTARVGWTLKLIPPAESRATTYQGTPHNAAATIR